MLELCWGLYGLEVWWGEYPAVYLSRDSRGRVFSPGLAESPDGMNREPDGFLFRQEGAS